MVYAQADANLNVLPKAEVGTSFQKSYEDFQNPERGMTGWADVQDVWEEGIQREINDGYRLLRTQIRLDEYRYGSIPDQLVQRLERSFAMVRRHGAKVIPRVIYNSPDSWFAGGVHIAEDAPVDRVIAHIQQLGPVFARNSDVIAWFEGGFVGAWGEWHSSMHGLDTPANKERIKNALLESFPQDRKISFRYPADVKRWYPDTQSPPAGGRIGIHSDCILMGEHDGSTWIGDNLKSYARTVTRTGPYGGETCEYYPQHTSCDAIRSHGKDLRLTWLNRYGAFNAYRNTWRAQGCEAEVLRSMGYRLELEELRLSSGTLIKGGSVEVTARMRNSGWAPVYNPRNLQLVLLNNGRPVSRINVPEADLRQVLPEGDKTESTNVRGQASIPSESPAGWFEIGVAAPDRNLPDDARQSLRFANQSRSNPDQSWVADGGYFRTGLWVQVVDR